MGARGPVAKPKLVVHQKMAVNRPAGRRRPGGPAKVKEMDKGKVLPVMLYPPVPLPHDAAVWYGKLVRRRAVNDQEPLLPTSRLRREDSLMVMTLAKMLAALDGGFNRMLAKDCNDLMVKLGCSPGARERLVADDAAKAEETEFDGF